MTLPLPDEADRLEDPIVRSFVAACDDLRRHRGYPCDGCANVQASIAGADPDTAERIAEITLRAHQEASTMTTSDHRPRRRELELVADRPAWLRWTAAATLTALLLVVWSVQYLLWIPAVYIVRGTVAVVMAALRLGVIGVLLLLLPVVGWIILAVWLMFRARERGEERRHAERMAAMGRAYDDPAIRRGVDRARLFYPWFLPTLRAVARA